MKAYWVKFNLYGASIEDPRGIQIIAKDKYDAWSKAVYEDIPEKYGEMPYSAWVYSVTYNNGNERFFNTFEGKPY